VKPITPFVYPKCCTPQRLSVYDALAAEVAAAVRKALR